jgi:hypothetical protein
MIAVPARGQGASGYGPGVLAALLLMSLAACDAGQGGDTQAAATPATGPTPQLWQVDVLGPSGAPQATVLACADDTLRRHFLLIRAQVDGRRCVDITPPVPSERGWVLRCESHGRWFTMSSGTKGDDTDDFRAEFAMTPLYPEIDGLREVRRFRRIGPCPAGWRVGDQAKPGQRPMRRKG